MNKEQKSEYIDELAGKLTESNVFYLADTSELTVADANELRGICFENGSSLTVVKNTLLRKAMEKVEGKDLSELMETLTGPTSIMFSEVGNAPAKVIKEFRKKSDKPILKAAFIEEAVFIGDEHYQTLADMKSKEEVIGDIILLLQSPIKNVVSALQSSEQTIAGLVKALEDKPADASSDESTEASTEVEAEAKDEAPAAEEATEAAAEEAEAPVEAAESSEDAAEGGTEEPAAEAEETAEASAEEATEEAESEPEATEEATDAPEGEAEATDEATEEDGADAEDSDESKEGSE